MCVCYYCHFNDYLYLVFVCLFVSMRVGPVCVVLNFLCVYVFVVLYDVHCIGG